MPIPPLKGLDGRPLGPYTLRLIRCEPTAKSGWTAFELTLCGATGNYVPGLVSGIFSVGGRGVFPWLDIRYQPFLEGEGKTVSLADHHLDVILFRLLASLIPPGGHIMVECESGAHQTTASALEKGVPPVATPLGSVLFDAGFPRVKYFYLPEGGWEGPRKLWAEKPLNAEFEQQWRGITRGEIEKFLETPSEASGVGPCVLRAKAILKTLTH